MYMYALSFIITENCCPYKKTFTGFQFVKYKTSDISQKDIKKTVIKVIDNTIR